MRVWKKDWNGRCRPVWINFIMVWTIPPIIGEIIGRIATIKFLGMVVGLIYSFIKTQYDYARAKFDKI